MQNEVRTDGNTVYVTLVGPQPSNVATDMLAQFKQAINRTASRHPKVYVYVDVRGVALSDISTDARLAMKEAFRMPFFRLAAVGHSRTMEVALYLMQAGGAVQRAQYFTSERSARRWLEAAANSQEKLSNAVLYAGLFIGLIGLSSLVGWITGEQFLIRWLSYIRPINPMASVGLLILGLTVASLWAGKRRLATIGAVAAMALGVLALLPLDIDFWILGERVKSADVHIRLADSAAICFILSGFSVWMLENRWRWTRWALRVSAAVIIFIASINFFGQLYAQGLLYGIGSSFGMALNLAAGFMIMGVLIAVAVNGNRLQALRQRVGVMGWLTVAVLVLVQIATCAAWRQAVDRNAAASQQAFSSFDLSIERTLGQRVRAYEDALHGFRGLFEASEFVGDDEFQTYYRSVDLGKNYPGLRSLVYISRVPESQLASFVAMQRAEQKKNNWQGEPFTIKQKDNVPVHYIVTYVAGTTNSAVLGRDITGDSSRRSTFEKAEITGNAVSSGTVSLAASPSSPAGKGFFIAVPVQQAINEPGMAKLSGADRYTGFVSAVFNYDIFFKTLFDGSTDDLEGANLAIQDAADRMPIYTANNADGTVAYIRRPSVAIADHTWQLTLSAPSNYGITNGQASLPMIVALSGQLLSVLLIVIFIVLGRARRDALQLADTITADLQQERNRAVELQQKDDAILSSIGDAVFAVDDKGRLTLFNPAAERISGYVSSEVIGRRYDEVLRFRYEKDDKPNTDFMRQALAGHETTMKNHTYLLHKDGHKVAVADSAAPIRESDSGTSGAIVVFRDVSQEQLLDRAKTEFVSLASHQLRTPLSAINWYSEMLLDGSTGKLSADQKEYAQEIFDGNQRMIELVNALLDVSRLELGKLTNEPQPMSLADMAGSLLKESLPTITHKQQQIVSNVDKKLPQIMADPKLLRMVLQNLLSNAIKYTPDKGKVSLAIQAAPLSLVKERRLPVKKPFYLIEVGDTGLGIPEAQQAKIFSKLFRADNVRGLDVEGTGLGLYIVKEVANNLGGTVWFESAENKGTTFYVLLPLIVYNDKK